MVYKLNGVSFNINQEQKIGNVNYPRGWFQDATNRVAMGITEEPDPVVVRPLAEVKAEKITMLSSQTYGNISKYMPDWRLNRWKAYYQLSKKTILDTLEQAEYDAFLDTGETHAQCSVYVPIALQWVIDCINYHKTVEAAITAATTEAGVNAVVVSYPVWPL